MKNKKRVVREIGRFRIKDLMILIDNRKVPLVMKEQKLLTKESSLVIDDLMLNLDLTTLSITEDVNFEKVFLLNKNLILFYNSLMRFFNNKFKLENCYNKEIDGKSWSDFSTYERRTLLERTIPFTVIYSDNKELEKRYLNKFYKEQL